AARDARSRRCDAAAGSRGLARPHPAAAPLGWGQAQIFTAEVAKVAEAGRRPIFWFTNLGALCVLGGRSLRLREMGRKEHEARKGKRREIASDSDLCVLCVLCG